VSSLGDSLVFDFPFSVVPAMAAFWSFASAHESSDKARMAVAIRIIGF
jgi:hypothetical protein